MFFFLWEIITTVNSILQNTNVNYNWCKMQFGALGINLAEMTGLITMRHKDIKYK